MCLVVSSPNNLPRRKRAQKLYKLYKPNNLVKLPSTRIELVEMLEGSGED